MQRIENKQANICEYIPKLFKQSKSKNDKSKSVTMSIDEEPFILVTSKRQKSKNNAPAFRQSHKQYDSVKNIHLFAEDNDKTFDKPAELRKIADFTQKIESSDYFNQSVEIVSNKSTKPITKIVCFGIGKVRHCSASRYQLAYILALRRHFQVESIQFHEPLLSRHDKHLLDSLNCELVSINIEGKLEIRPSETTLVFLPHCPKQLINNLLWKNWSAAALRQIVLISNSFQAIVQQTPISCLEQDAGYISRIESYTTEFSLRNSFEHKNVFNDIAIHFFNADNYEENFFDRHRQEPSYDTSELIETIDRLTIR